MSNVMDDNPVASIMGLCDVQISRKVRDKQQGDDDEEEGTEGKEGNEGKERKDEKDWKDGNDFLEGAEGEKDDDELKFVCRMSYHPADGVLRKISVRLYVCIYVCTYV